MRFLFDENFPKGARVLLEELPLGDFGYQLRQHGQVFQELQRNRVALEAGPRQTRAQKGLCFHALLSVSMAVLLALTGLLFHVAVRVTHCCRPANIPSGLGRLGRLVAREAPWAAASPCTRFTHLTIDLAGCIALYVTTASGIARWNCPAGGQPSAAGCVSGATATVAPDGAARQAYCPYS